MASKRLFKIEPHTGIDKSFEITGPEGFTLKVDYDDVDHKYVDSVAKLMVNVLNRNTLMFSRVDDWRTPFNEDEDRGGPEDRRGQAAPLAATKSSINTGMPEPQDVGFKKTAAAETQYSTGAQRDSRSGKGAFHWMPWDAVWLVSNIYERGNKGRSKTGDGNDRNWENGMPLIDLLQSAMNHITAHISGDREPVELCSDFHLGHPRIPSEGTQQAAGPPPPLEAGRRAALPAVPAGDRVAQVQGRDPQGLPGRPRHRARTVA
jgi:hypothetical protein